MAQKSKSGQRKERGLVCDFLLENGAHESANEQMQCHIIPADACSMLKSSLAVKSSEHRQRDASRNRSGVRLDVNI